MMDKIFLILGIIISYTYSDVYELYRVSYDGKQKSMEFNGQPNANKINCEYIKKILDQDDYQAVSEGKRKYLCELASKNKSNSMYLYRTTISGSTKEDFEHLQWLCESSKINPDQMDYCITLTKAARMMYIATFDNNQDVNVNMESCHKIAKNLNQLEGANIKYFCFSEKKNYDARDFIKN